MTQPIDLSSSRRIHIIGVGGAGMGAIAHVLHRMGHQVSGSDLTASAAFERLVAEGVDARLGHDGANVAEADLVVRSTAIPDRNVEVRAVVESGGVVHRRADVLGAICRLRRTAAIAGTHGKTTTSSMLAVISLAAESDPSFIIGGDITELGTGATWNPGKWFIVEADESDGTFLELGHTLGLVTNVEPDHLEHYGGEPQLRAAFHEFIEAADVGVVCLDDNGAATLARSSGVVTYGLHADSTYRIVDLSRGGFHTSFRLHRAGLDLGEVRVPMPGVHNARNAAGAAAAAIEMGLPFSAVVSGLATFRGVGRRFQPRGNARGVTFIDDYAHLPTEVAAALDAAADTGHDRVVAIFQPHRYSRTAALWRDFAGSFDRADLLVVTDVYASGEPPREGVSGELIVEAARSSSEPPPIVYLPDRSTLATEVASILRPGDLCLTLGAGDSVELPDEILALLGGADG
ncbi:MAG: UDP-N-acetylmuramate--L-alanine ligase [Acidimicrobiales bacterium]